MHIYFVHRCSVETLCSRSSVYFYLAYRAEKSEVLNEEEQTVEKRVELLKNVCQNFHKKITAFLKSHGSSTDVEKRLVRKVFEWFHGREI